MSFVNINVRDCYKKSTEAATPSVLDSETRNTLNLSSEETVLRALEEFKAIFLSPLATKPQGRPVRALGDA